MLQIQWHWIFAKRNRDVTASPQMCLLTASSPAPGITRMSSTPRTWEFTITVTVLKMVWSLKLKRGRQKKWLNAFNWQNRYCSGMPTVKNEGDAVKVRVGGWVSPKRRCWNPAGSFPFNHVTSKTSLPLHSYMEPVITSTVAHYSLLSHSLRHIQLLLRVSLEQNAVSTISDKSAPTLLTNAVWPPLYGIYCNNWILNKAGWWLTNDHGKRLKSSQSDQIKSDQRERESSENFSHARVTLPWSP